MFVQRGEHGAAMRARGLRVTSPLGDLALPDVTVLDPAEAGAAGPVDLALVTVKSIHTESAAEAAAAMTGAANRGAVAAERRRERRPSGGRAWGRGRLLGGLCYILSLIESPGVIRHGMKTARIEFGERSGGRQRAASRRSDGLAKTPVSTRWSWTTFDAAIWTKFTMLCAHNAA